MNRRLYVGGLPWAADDQALREAFSAHGTVTDAAIIKDRETGRSRGFGFVTFETGEMAEAAVKAMDGQQLGGRRITVREAEERGPRPGGGGGPRFGGPGGRGGGDVPVERRPGGGPRFGGGGGGGGGYGGGGGFGGGGGGGWDQGGGPPAGEGGEGRRRRNWGGGGGTRRGGDDW
jgi:hypothetical protein